MILSHSYMEDKKQKQFEDSFLLNRASLILKQFNTFDIHNGSLLPPMKDSKNFRLLSNMDALSPPIFWDVLCVLCDNRW